MTQPLAYAKIDFHENTPLESKLATQGAAEIG